MCPNINADFLIKKVILTYLMQCNHDVFLATKTEQNKVTAKNHLLSLYR